MDKSKNPAIPRMSVKHHRQNPLEVMFCSSMCMHQEIEINRQEVSDLIERTEHSANKLWKTGNGLQEGWKSETQAQNQLWSGTC
jgi:hypothetical protein